MRSDENPPDNMFAIIQTNYICRNHTIEYPTIISSMYPELKRWQLYRIRRPMLYLHNRLSSVCSSHISVHCCYICSMQTRGGCDDDDAPQLNSWSQGIRLIKSIKHHPLMHTSHRSENDSSTSKVWKTTSSSSSRQEIDCNAQNKTKKKDSQFSGGRRWTSHRVKHDPLCFLQTTHEGVSLHCQM